MRRDQPLSIRQVEVLQWINHDYPDGVWPDFNLQNDCLRAGGTQPGESRSPSRVMVGGPHNLHCISAAGCRVPAQANSHRTRVYALFSCQGWHKT
jgi:hypothetical protein